LRVRRKLADVWAEETAQDTVKPVVEVTKVVAAGLAWFLCHCTKVGRCLCLGDYNVLQLESFNDGDDVGVEELLKAGLIQSCKSKVKILGDGELTKKLQVTAHKFSKAAEQKIVSCGGTAKIISEQ
jgi:hypothetical protein